MSEIVQTIHQRCKSQAQR